MGNFFAYFSNWVSKDDILNFYECVIEQRRYSDDNFDNWFYNSLYTMTKTKLACEYNNEMINNLEKLINIGLSQGEVANIYSSRCAFNKYKNNMYLHNKNILKKYYNISKLKNLDQLWTFTINEKHRSGLIDNYNVCPICYYEKITCNLSCKHGYCINCFMSSYHLPIFRKCFVCNQQIKNTLLLTGKLLFNDISNTVLKL